VPQLKKPVDKAVVPPENSTLRLKDLTTGK